MATGFHSRVVSGRLVNVLNRFAVLT
jgi:hypothetical protein